MKTCLKNPRRRGGMPAAPGSTGTGRFRRRLLPLVWMLAAVLPMTSCRKAVEKARENIKLEAIEKVQLTGLTGIEAVVRIMNETSYKLRLENASADILYAGGKAATVTLNGAVEVPPHTTCSVSSSWKISISNPITVYQLIRKVKADDISQVTVTFSAEGQGGPVPVKIARENVPLSDILDIFGMTLQDAKKYIPL